MVEPSLQKHPAEIFGYPYTRKREVLEAMKSQHCIFSGQECAKPRKSQPQIKVGTCSVGYKGKRSAHYVPVIICPKRFAVADVFSKIEAQYFGKIPQGYVIRRVSEVSMGVGGSVDYVFAKMHQFGGVETIEDFVCVEFQAAGTTGTPWLALEEYRTFGKFLSKTYAFDLNWANEFVKTMMQQVLKKGLIVEDWGKTIVFVLQDVGMDYLNSFCDTSGLHKPDPKDSIRFYTFKSIWSDEDKCWKLVFDQEVSTDTEGVARILSGAPKEKYPTIQDFKNSIRNKLVTSSYR